jgi:hypothetical protein
MSFLQSNYYKRFCQISKNNIVIDCGHTPITMNNGKIIYGEYNARPSNSAIETLQKALEISQNLISIGKEVIINICFSDVGYKINPEIRKKLKFNLKDKKSINVMPQEYKEILEQSFNNNLLNYNLQSSNSNLACAKIKKIKKELMGLTSKKAFEKYFCYFLIKNDCTFGILSPLLINDDCEMQQGDQKLFNKLLYSHAVPHESDIQKFPLLKLKRSRFFGLYDKFDGILCPGTYLGNLCSISSSSDVISIYSRADDSNIGEKILAGAISYQHISNNSQLFFSIVNQEFSGNSENFLLENKPSLYKEKNTSEELFKFLLDRDNFKVYL